MANSARERNGSHLLRTNVAEVCGIVAAGASISSYPLSSIGAKGIRPDRASICVMGIIDQLLHASVVRVWGINENGPSWVGLCHPRDGLFDQSGFWFTSSRLEIWPSRLNR